MTTSATEQDEFLDSVERLRRGEVGGVEVASAPLPSVGQMLVAGLVHHQGERLSLELARWVMDADGKVGTPVTAANALRIEDAAGLRDILALLDAAGVALPSVELEDDGRAVLVSDETYAVAVGQPPEQHDEPLWLAVVEIETGRGVAVPADELAQIRAVIEEALAVLGKAGMVAGETVVRH